MSLMSRTWFVRCLSTNILDAPATVFLHVYTYKNGKNQSRISQMHSENKHIMNPTARESCCICI